MMMRRWHYRTINQGDQRMDFPLETKEVDVRRMLDEGYRRGYWSALRKGGKVEKESE
ncbi:MAG: hypothetical protein HY225_03555 [Candidatus Vogelbacteria bacterium]|nr:hypothetical protein [Candidatus Vogelbacteria bacterium]